MKLIIHDITKKDFKILHENARFLASSKPIDTKLSEKSPHADQTLENINFIFVLSFLLILRERFFLQKCMPKIQKSKKNELIVLNECSRLVG